jgi:hypothetical protein
MGCFLGTLVGLALGQGLIAWLRYESPEQKLADVMVGVLPRGGADVYP